MAFFYVRGGQIYLTITPVAAKVGFIGVNVDGRMTFVLSLLLLWRLATDIFHFQVGCWMNIVGL